MSTFDKVRLTVVGACLFVFGLATGIAADRSYLMPSQPTPVPQPSATPAPTPTPEPTIQPTPAIKATPVVQERVYSIGQQLLERRVEGFFYIETLTLRPDKSVLVWMTVYNPGENSWTIFCGKPGDESIVFLDGKKSDSVANSLCDKPGQKDTQLESKKTLKVWYLFEPIADISPPFKIVFGGIGETSTIQLGS